MVEIKSGSITQFLETPDVNMRLIVLAGRDRGRVKESATMITNKWMGTKPDPMNLSVLHATEWTANPDCILEVALSPSLIGGNRVVRIVDGAQSLKPVMERWLSVAHTSSDTIVIIEAGDLSKKDSLRKFAIKESKVAMLFFYAAEDRAIIGLIREILQNDNGFLIDADAMALLKQNLGADWAVSRSELEKLALYAYGEKEITTEHVLAIISDAAGIELEDLCHAISLGDLRTLDREFYRLIESNQNVNSVLSIVRVHFSKLIELRFHMDQGMDFSNASSQLKPPLFWKSKPKFKMAISKWSAQSLDFANKRLLDALVDVRTTGRPEIETAERALFALAMMVKRNNLLP